MLPISCQQDRAVLGWFLAALMASLAGSCWRRGEQGGAVPSMLACGESGRQRFPAWENRVRPQGAETTAAETGSLRGKVGGSFAADAEGTAAPGGEVRGSSCHIPQKRSLAGR